jgi:pimeloyl-ACP methyl ester carboxylesterase
MSEAKRSLISEDSSGSAFAPVADRKAPPLLYLQRQGRPDLAYRRLEGAEPGIVFLGGFRSTMDGTKALLAECIARERGRAFLRFDYSGHSASGGHFEDGTVGAWKQDALDILDHVTHGPQILVGSSLGGWLALLVALERPQSIHSLILVSCAADFTEHIYWRLLDEDQRQLMDREGAFAFPNCQGGEPFVITAKLIEEGRRHLILPREHLPIDVPVTLLVGKQDQDVPWQTSDAIAERLPKGRASVITSETARHQFDRPEDLLLLRQAIEESLESS